MKTMKRIATVASALALLAAPAAFAGDASRDVDELRKEAGRSASAPPTRVAACSCTTERDAAAGEGAQPRAPETRGFTDQG